VTTPAYIPADPAQEIADLRARLEEAQETLRAIQAGEVDALVMGEEVYTLKGAETPYRVLVEQMYEGAGTLLDDGTVLYANRRLGELLRIPLQELIGTSLRRFVAPTELPAFDKLLAEGKQCSSKGEFTLQRQGDSALSVQLSFSVVQEQDTRPICVTVTDLTERKRAELALRQSHDSLEQRVVERTAELRESEERFRSVLDNAMDCIYRINLQTSRYEYISPSVEEIVGFSPDELMTLDAETALAMIHPDDLPAVRAALSRLGQTGHVEAEYRQRAKSGDYRWISNHMSLSRDSAGQPLYRDGTIRDITEHRRLEESRANLAAIVESSEDAIISKNLDGLITSWNSGAEHLLGYRADELVGQSIVRIIPPELQAEEATILGRLRRGQSIAHYETVRLASDGRRVPVSITISPIRDTSGAIIGASKIARDITERKQAEEALRASERLYRAIGESIDYGIWICDAEGRNIYASESFLKLVGITQKQCSEFGWGDVLHPEDTEATIAAWKECVRTGGPWYREHRFRGADGQWHPVLACGVAVRDEKGQIVRWTGINLDISRLKRAEETLRESEAQLRLAQETANVGIWDWKVETGALDFTPELNKLYGLPPGTIKTYQDWRVRVHQDDIGRIEAARDEAIAKHEPFDLEFRGRHSSGEYRWISTKGGAIYSRAGKAVRVFGVNIDITDRKRAEEKLRESEERFRVAQELSPDGFAILRPVRDSEGRIVDFTFVYENAAIARINGTDPAAVVGRRISEFMPAHSQSPFHEAHAHVADTGETCIMEQKYDGGDIPRPTWFRVVVVRTGQDIAILSQDITERKQADEAVRQSEEQFRALAETITNLAWWANADGYITWYNRRWYEYTGTTPQQMEGWGWQSVHDPQALPAVMERWKASIATGEPFEMTFPLRGADGVFRRFLTRIQPVKDAQGRVVRWFGTNTDVEELKRTEEALREAEQRLRFALETSHTGAWDLDLVDHTAFRSQEHDRVFGYPELLPQWTYEMFLQHLLPEDRAAVDEKFRQATATQGVWDFECRIRRADGEVRWIWGAGRHRTDAAGGKRRMAGIVQDITERKRTEERIQASLREKEVMLKEIHHRVKNNLQVISSLVDLQTNSLNDPVLRGLFRDVRNRVRSMALVHEKLYQSANLASVDFADYTRSLIGFLSRAHGGSETAVRFKLDLQPVALPVETAVPCGLILNELVTNAFKHAFRGRAEGEVTTALSTGPDGRVSLRVSDDGVGLPAGLDWRQSRSLGLQLIHLLSGQLDATVEVRTGVGTEFLISFKQPQGAPAEEQTHA
jgi:PAS domain S-box-containing protein